MERLDERQQEIKGDLDQLDQKGEQMDERTDDFEREVGEVREDFESKQESGDVPGLQPRAESQGSDVDPRPGESESAGGEGEEGQATGNPPADDAAEDDAEDE